MRANPFKHQLQGQVYAEVIAELRRRIKALGRGATVPVKAGKVNAPAAPATVYVVMLNGRPVLQGTAAKAFTDLGTARREAQFIATGLDLPVEVHDMQNGAFVARRGSRRPSAASFGMNVNPTPKKRAFRNPNVAWAILDHVGQLVGRAGSKISAEALALQHANRTGRRAYVESVKRGKQ